ncbi:hypothetical protein [Paenibacillus taichungensis]
MQKWIRLKHIEGLPNCESNKNVVLSIKGNEVVLNTKQIIPFNRINGCDLEEKVITIPGSPLGQAISYGIIATVLGGILGLIINGSGSLGILTGLIGAIIGAIIGTRNVTKGQTILMLNYRTIEGNVSVLTFALVPANTQSKIALIKITNHINDEIGYQMSDSVKVKREYHEI